MVRYDSDSDDDNDTIRHDTIQCLARRYDTMRIRYGYGADTVRNDTIHWFVIVMTPPRLIGFVRLSSSGFSHFIKKSEGDFIIFSIIREDGRGA